MHQLSLFSNERLPHKPWCGDGNSTGLYVKPLASALLKRFLQFNPPHALYWIVIDIDAPIALGDREIPSAQMMSILDGDVPTPNFLVVNPTNGHAHGFYALETAVAKGEHASQKALRYAAAIEAALIRALGGDALYVGLVAKNPTHPDWRLWKLRDEPYTLGELHDNLDLRGPSKSRLRKEAIGQGLGRNCELFDRLRLHAYKMVDLYRQDSTEALWRSYCQSKAESYNESFSSPLDPSEVKHIAKSVSLWTWRHYTGRMSDKAFSAKQAARGAKGGRISAKKRAAELGDAYAETLREQGRSFKGKGITDAKPWEELGISRRQWYRDQKQADENNS